MAEGRLVKTWEVSAFDRVNNEWTTELNHSYDHTVPEQIPDFINQAAPTKITPSRRSKPSRAEALSVIFPDSQIPFHDPVALSLAHVAVRETVPDNVVLVGDMVDFPSLSRFGSRPEWNNGIQSALDQTHRMLAQIRSNAPDTKIHYIFGNHELRLQKSILENNAELLGIKRANAERELGVLTLEFLLRCQELEVNVVGGYPNGVVWLENHLRVIHGTSSNSRGSTSAKYLNEDPHVSTIHGHSHRSEIQWRTTPTRDGYIQRFGMSPGTLADITGNVPSYYSTIDEQGVTIPKAENWQQAIGIIEHDRYNANPHLAMISNGLINILGKRYAA